MKHVKNIKLSIYGILWICMIAPFGICLADDGFDMETYINEFLITYEAKNEPFIFTLKALSDLSKCGIFINDPGVEESWLDATVSVKLKNNPLRFGLEKVLAKAGIVNYVLELDNKTKAINITVLDQGSAVSIVDMDKESSRSTRSRQKNKTEKNRIVVDSEPLTPPPKNIPPPPGVNDAGSSARSGSLEPPPENIPPPPGVNDPGSSARSGSLEPPPENIPPPPGVIDKGADNESGNGKSPAPPSVIPAPGG